MQGVGVKQGRRGGLLSSALVPVFQINDVRLGDRCEGLVEWRELMGRSVAQTHPGSSCLLPPGLLIGFSTLPCCSHTQRDAQVAAG